MIKSRSILLSSTYAFLIITLLSACTSEADWQTKASSPTTNGQDHFSVRLESHAPSIDTISIVADTTKEQWEQVANEGNTNTRTVLTVASNNTSVTATWKQNDAAYFVSAGNNTATLNAATTAKTTDFKGYVTATLNEQFAIFYPNINGTTVTKSGNNQTLNLNIATQDGTLEGIADKLDFTYAKGKITSVDNGSKIGTVNTTNNLTTIVRLAFKTAENTDIKDITSLEIQGVNTTATLNLLGNGINVSGSYSNTIQISNLGNGQGVQYIYVALFPGTSKITFKATRKSNGFTYAGVFNSANYSTASTYIRACTCLYPYVQVGNKKWATGNLYFDGSSFHIADQQHYLVQDLESPNNPNDVNANRKPQTDKVDLFYFSAITGSNGKFRYYPSSRSEERENVLVLYKYNSISGLLFPSYYTTRRDQASSVWRQNARWGDISFWATKGAYRLPEEDEYRTLLTYPHHFAYVEDNGKKVYGVLFDLTPQKKYVSTTSWNTNNPARYTLAQVQTSEVLFLPSGGIRDREKIKDGSFTRASDRYSIAYQTGYIRDGTYSHILYANESKIEMSRLQTERGSNIRPILNF